MERFFQIDGRRCFSKIKCQEVRQIVDCMRKKRKIYNECFVAIDQVIVQIVGRLLIKSIKFIFSLRRNNMGYVISVSTPKVQSNPQILSQFYCRQAKFPSIQQNENISTYLNNLLDDCYAEEIELDNLAKKMKVQARLQQGKEQKISQQKINSQYIIVLEIRNLSDFIALLESCSKQLAPTVNLQSNFNPKMSSPNIGRYQVPNRHQDYRNQDYSQKQQKRKRQMQGIKTAIQKGQQLYQSNILTIRKQHTLTNRIIPPFQTNLEWKKRLEKRDKQSKVEFLWRIIGGRFDQIGERYERHSQGSFQTINRVYAKFEVALATSQSSRNKYFLELSQVPLNEQFIKKMGSFKWMQIEVLKLNFCGIDDCLWKVLIENLTKFSQLQLMQIYGNEISKIIGQNLKQIPESVKCIVFSHLDASNPLSTESIKQLRLYQKDERSKTFVFNEVDFQQKTSEKRYDFGNYQYSLTTDDSFKFSFRI